MYIAGLHLPEVWKAPSDDYLGGCHDDLHGGASWVFVRPSCPNCGPGDGADPQLAPGGACDRLLLLQHLRVLDDPLRDDSRDVSDESARTCRRPHGRAVLHVQLHLREDVRAHAGEHGEARGVRVLRVDGADWDDFRRGFPAGDERKDAARDRGPLQEGAEEHQGGEVGVEGVGRDESLVVFQGVKMREGRKGWFFTPGKEESSEAVNLYIFFIRVYIIIYVRQYVYINDNYTKRGSWGGFCSTISDFERVRKLQMIVYVVFFLRRTKYDRKNRGRAVKKVFRKF